MQNTYRLPALFESCEEGGYTVTFLDLLDIVTEGNNVDEAIAMAKEVLALHILGMERDGDIIPTSQQPGETCPVGRRVLFPGRGLFTAASWQTGQSVGK